MPWLEASISIRCGIEHVFDFLTEAQNISKIVPPELQVKLVRSPERVELGSLLEIQILGFGLPQQVVYKITEFARPSKYIEAQVRGPLGRYVHKHSFSAQEDGCVLVTDRIDFDPPRGLMGFMLTAERLRLSFERGLTHRHRELKRLLEEA